VIRQGSGINELAEIKLEDAQSQTPLGEVAQHAIHTYLSCSLVGHRAVLAQGVFYTAIFCTYALC